MAQKLNRAIELHDSRITAIVRRGDGSVEIRFGRAYVHASSERPGSNAGIGGLQFCSMIVGRGRIEGEVGDLPSHVFTGDLRIGDQVLANIIPLPCHVVDQEVEVILFLSPDNRRVAVSGIGLEVLMEGETEFTEVFPG